MFNKKQKQNKRTVPVLSGGSALCVHAVHRHCRLQVVRMRVQRVVVRVRVPVGVELVAEQCRRLRGSVQVQVVVVVANVDAGRKRVVVSRRILAVLLRAHGTVAWTQKRCAEDCVISQSFHSKLLGKFKILSKKILKYMFQSLKLNEEGSVAKQNSTVPAHVALSVMTPALRFNRNGKAP